MAYEKVSGPGWRGFAGTMLLLVGFFNIIDGLIAITNSQYYVPNLLFSDLKTWGWVVLVIGVIELCAAFSVFAAMPFGAIVGIAVASLSAIVQLAWFQHSPAVSVLIIAVDVLVIYGLAVYGTDDVVSS